MAAASRKTGISRYSLYAWKRRAERAAKGEGASPTSGPDPKDIEARRDQEILAIWRKHPGLGPSQIRNQLRRAGIKVSTHTVRRVMEDAGYRAPKAKRSKHDERFEAVRPNHMWHLDFVQRWIGRASTFTLILIIDDYWRTTRVSSWVTVSTMPSAPIWSSRPLSRPWRDTVVRSG